jgi:hypothetical protein
VFFTCVKLGGTERLCERRCTLPYGRLWSEGTWSAGPGMLDEAFGREKGGFLVREVLCYIGCITLDRKSTRLNSSHVD